MITRLAYTFIHSDEYYEMKQEWQDDCEGLSWHNYIKEYWHLWSSYDISNSVDQFDCEDEFLGIVLSYVPNYRKPRN